MYFAVIVCTLVYKAVYVTAGLSRCVREFGGGAKLPTVQQSNLIWGESKMAITEQQKREYKQYRKHAAFVSTRAG
jgi:hypothetical protein